MRKYTSKGLKLSYILLAAAVSAVIFAAAAVQRCDKKLSALVNESAEQQTSELIYKELDSFIAQKGDMGELIHISYDSGGNITGITADSARINQINSELGCRLSDKLDSLKDRETSFPAGTLSGIDFLSGRGFDIKVSYHSIQNVTTQLVSEFEDCGINQTRHSLKLLISAKISVVMPLKDITVDTKQEFLISETVIVGKIPSVYMENNKNSR